MRAMFTGVLLLAALAAAGAPALAGSGKALGVDPAAEAQRASGVQRLVVGADVFIGDRVVTGPSGQVQILFDDSTELVVGPGSALLIEDYLLRQDGSAGRLALTALAGTFRFVTGSAPKDRYTIKTPTATIGVRGTAFDLFVTEQWSFALVHEGAIIGCNPQDDCVVTEARCDVGQFSAADAILVGPANRLSSADRARLRQLFIYAASQRPLLARFRIAAAETCLRPPPPPVGTSLSEPGESAPLPQTPGPDTGPP
ncbi:FecR family protein [Devosia sp.]|uniref:FecR family protein n=1 Tax=Devosia sp. TaxID=1871048 RepID=UPI002EE86635